MIPLIEAHRGDSANAPENTLAAFRRALDLGVASIELDIHPSRGGALMVIHDDTVDRTTDDSGRVSEMTVAELRRLDAGTWFDPAFAGERIPRLSEVLQLVAPTRTSLNLEIKATSARTHALRTLAKLLRRFGKEREYVVSSFDLACLLKMRAVAPEITLALIGNGPEILPLAEQHNLPWIHCHRRTVHRKLVARAHRHSIRVSVWTVDDPRSLPHWQSLGVDKICTNRPALLGALHNGCARYIHF